MTDGCLDAIIVLFPSDYRFLGKYFGAMPEDDFN